MNPWPPSAHSNPRQPSDTCSLLRPQSARCVRGNSVSRRRQSYRAAIVGDVHDTTAASRRAELPPSTGDVGYGRGVSSLTSSSRRRSTVALEREMRLEGGLSKNRGYPVNVSAYLSSSTETLAPVVRTRPSRIPQLQPEISSTDDISVTRSRDLLLDGSLTGRQCSTTSSVLTVQRPAVSTSRTLTRPSDAAVIAQPLSNVRTLTRPSDAAVLEQNFSTVDSYVSTSIVPFKADAPASTTPLNSSRPLRTTEQSSAPTQPVVHTRQRRAATMVKLRNEPELRFMLLMTGLNERTTATIIEAARTKIVPGYPDVLSKRVLHLMSLFDSKSVGEVLNTCPGLLRYGNKRMSTLMQEFAQQLKVSMPEVLPLLVRQPSLFAYFVGVDVFCSYSIM